MLPLDVFELRLAALLDKHIDVLCREWLASHSLVCEANGFLGSQVFLQVASRLSSERTFYLIVPGEVVFLLPVPTR